MVFNAWILYLLLVNSFSFCKEGKEFENQEKSNAFKSDNIYFYFPHNLSSFLDNNNANSKINSDIEEQIIYKEFYLNNVQTELLYNEKIYIFNFPYYYNDKKVMIHFYPLDCQIKISGENEEGEINLERIDNYEIDAFYAIIESDQIKSTEFKIKTLINSIEDYKNNRTFHLVINSFEYYNKTNLYIKDIQPTFLYFYDLDKINLLYKFNGYIDYPISISFFIKERVKFKVTVSKLDKEIITIITTIIGYSDRILIAPCDFPKTPGSNIIISIEKIEQKKGILIAKVVGDYEKPKYFQKNFLNIEFIPGNASYQYYYMEVFKGEEGEIVLNNKKYDGILISDLIQKEKAIDYEIFLNSGSYPKYKSNNNLEDYLQYNEYSQNLYFNLLSDKCKDGCYLLLTYYSRYLKEINSQTIRGTEFTLLSRIINEEESKFPIINIPLNEYIFGKIDKPFNIHYYSIYIPENSNILFEIHKYNIYGYAKEGVKRFNINNGNLLYNIDSEDSIYEFNPEFLQMNSFGGKYITFAFDIYNRFENSKYYFRILQLNTTNKIYPLDTNKANLCKTTEIKEIGIYSCFFLIKNTYKDLYNDLIIYAYGNKKIKYIAWIENDKNDYYSIDLDNLTKKKNITENRTFFKIYNKSNSKYIILNIQSNSSEHLTILTNYFDKKIFFPSIQIYSYQLYYLCNTTLTFNFNFNLYSKFRLFINNAAGKGEFFFENKFITISGKKILSFLITKRQNNSYIYSPNEMAFNIKIDYELYNEILQELKFNNEDTKEEEKNIIGYYLKEIEYKGADINVYFDFNNLDKRYNIKEDFIIRGYQLNYEQIKYIDSEELLLYILDSWIGIEGSYDERQNNGILVFDKENFGNIQFGMDIYYLIIIYNNAIISNFNLTMLALSKDDPKTSLPINKYISGSFDLTKEENQSQKYYIQGDENENNNNFIIEFSSNYKNIELKFNKNFKNWKENEIEGGVQKYFINISFSDNETENYFEVKINNLKNKIDDYLNLDKANYILKYYTYDNNNLIKFTSDFDFTFEAKNKKPENTSYLIIENKKGKNNNFSEKYEFSYFLSIYEKKKVLKNELINTIAPINSEIIESYHNFSYISLNILSYNLNNLLPNENYVVSLFIKIEKNDKEDQKLYYSYTFDITTKKESKNKISSYLIIVLIILIIILIVCFIFLYRRFKIKNKNLKEQVQAISFSSGINEDVIDKTKNKSKDDEDYETTFI